MILHFPFQDEPLSGQPPPSLPSTAQLRWRPLVPIRIIGPDGQAYRFGRALVDSGADDTIFPLDIAMLLNVRFRPSTRHVMSWRGQQYPLRYGDVHLELSDDDGLVLRWSATVAFSEATLRYPLLGICGCFEFMQVTFVGSERTIEIEPTESCPILPAQ